MSVALKRSSISPEQYLDQERQAETRSEYYDGEIIAMSGGSREHSLIAANLIRELGLQLLEKPCEVHTSDLKVQAAASAYAYPDVTVVCGPPEFLDTEGDVLLNPTVIVEVLSPTTEAWDRGGKFDYYRERQSLQEYVLVAQDRPQVERFMRQSDEQWLLAVIKGLDAEFSLPSIGCELALARVYHRVKFPEEVGPRR
jgi:Uma2 family endonuclease